MDTIIAKLLTGLTIAAVTSLITTYINSRLRLKQQKRLSDNLNRPIAFVKNNANLKNNEINLLKDCGLFKGIVVFDNANITIDQSYGLIIYVFNYNNNEYAEHIATIAKSKNIPIILYANNLFLNEEDKKDIMPIVKYAKTHMTQYTLNLLSAVFTTLSTHNHGTK